MKRFSLFQIISLNLLILTSARAEERSAKLLFLQNETAMTRDIEWRSVDFAVDWHRRTTLLYGRFNRPGWSLRLGEKTLVAENAENRHFEIALLLSHETTTVELTAIRGDEIETQDYTVRIKDWKSHSLGRPSPP
jgi:hypothetical protein